MKTKCRNLLALLFFLSILLDGCQSPSSRITPTPEPTNTETSTVAISPTITQATDTPTLEPTSAATLSASEAYTHLEELLKSSSSCQLPCWLGIIPGQNTWQEANALLSTFNGISRHLYIGPNAEKGSAADLSIPYQSDDMVVEISPSFLSLPGESKVSLIGMYTRSYKLKNGQYNGDVYEYGPYNDLLKAYTISGVLTQYGQPTQVFVLASLRSDTWPKTPGYGDYFEIHLWYPDQGIFLVYKMAVERSGENYRFCPSQSLISGYLLEPSLKTNYQDVLIRMNDDYRDFFKPSIYVKNSEDAFGMTLEKFYQTFLSPTNQCLETPISIWWPK
jgi:hypothetical protein